MKGILFRPWKIKAMAEHPDIVTVTRRVIKPQPIDCVAELKRHSEYLDYYIPYTTDRKVANDNEGYRKDDCGYVPRYQVGEIVYVKEAWCAGSPATETGRGIIPITHVRPALGMKVVYKLGSNYGGDDPPWRSPLFMPAWAARYFIKILDVRAERLQEITGEDCVKEGIALPHRVFGDGDSEYFEAIEKEYINLYHRLWDSINKDYPWESTPFIWRYAFSLKEGNDDKAMQA